MRDVPRTEKGWPSVRTSEMTTPQVFREALRWASHRGLGNVGDGEFQTYDEELRRRGVTLPWRDIVEQEPS